MKKILIQIILMLSTMVVSGQNFGIENSDNRINVAVYVIDGDLGMADYVSASVVDALVHNGDYTAVERTAEFLGKINSEQEYQRTGMTEEEQIASLGKQFGAKLVCVVKIGTMTDKYFMQARLLDVETAHITNSTKAFVFSLDDVEMACSEMVSQLLTENSNDRSIQGAFK